MPLTSGTRLGPYEVLAPLGAGGMGEVYRARDTRLGRDVAIKVLPADVASDRQALARLESEARAVAALSHPHILALFDIGEEAGTRYVVTELLQGETLRVALERGAFPVRRALEVAEQVARALAAAHEEGLVHRDVKPENVFLTKDGSAKLLDFGLARPSAPATGPGGTPCPTAPLLSGRGALVGTAAYVSPEQAQGLEVDHRSDQFSLGVVLYEMLAGKRPFQGGSAAETLAAVLRTEPESLSRVAPDVPAPVRWLVERCLAKEADARYDSTRDLARDISSWWLRLSEGGVPAVDLAPAAPAARGRKRPARTVALAAVLVAASLAGGFVAGRRSARAPGPRFQQLTFDRGAVTGARFAPDGRTVVYSATRGGEPSAVYSMRLDTLDAVPSGYPGAHVLAVSAKGRLALSLQRGRSHAWFSPGTLALAAFSGETPHELDQEVSFADFARDGEKLAIVRGRRGSARGAVSLEYPSGNVLHRSTGWDWPSDVRLSPSGELLAFVDNTHYAWAGGDVVVVDRSGRTILRHGPFYALRGLSWAPRGDEVWFSGGSSGLHTELRAVTLDGRERLLLAVPGSLLLHDVSADGRVLASTVETRARVFFRGATDSADRELSVAGAAETASISPDGAWVAFAEVLPGRPVQACVRSASGAPPIRIGPGRPGAFARDGRTLVVLQPDLPGLLLQPVGPGTPKAIRLPGLVLDRSVSAAGFFPDGTALWFEASAPSRPPRTWKVDVAGGTPRPLTPEGVAAVVTPDGESLVFRRGRHRIVQPVAGGAALPLKGLLEDEIIAASAKGGPLLVWRFGECPARIFRLDPETGTRALFREIGPADCTGVQGVYPTLTPDGKAFAYDVWEWLTQLHLIEGLE